MNQRDISVVNKSVLLKNKKIAFAITGSIAAIKTPEIIREIRRHAAEVTVYSTPTALSFIGKTALEWASGNQVVDSYSSFANHICEEDILLVIPATANTISKVVVGMQDNPVTSLIASALGSAVNVASLKNNAENSKSNHKLIFFLPAMHESLKQNPLYQKNESTLKQIENVFFLESRIEEGKYKIPLPIAITQQIIHRLYREKLPAIFLKNKILITGGAVPTYIDDVRLLSNVFSGETAIQMAIAAYQKGISIVLLLSAYSSSRPPDYLLPYTFFYRDYQNYREQLFTILQKDKIMLGIFSAAVADYQITKTIKGKSSATALNKIDLQPTEKIIDLIRQKFKILKMVVFKYEHQESLVHLENQVKRKLAKGFDYVIANRQKDIADNQAHFYVNHFNKDLTFSKQKIGNRKDIIHVLLKEIYNI